eukprot:14346346-Alexandrium_andersonii.AAC.1
MTRVPTGLGAGIRARTWINVLMLTASTGPGGRIRARVKHHHDGGALRGARRQDPHAHVEQPQRHDPHPHVVHRQAAE